MQVAPHAPAPVPEIVHINDPAAGTSVIVVPLFTARPTRVQSFHVLLTCSAAAANRILVFSAQSGAGEGVFTTSGLVTQTASQVASYLGGSGLGFAGALASTVPPSRYAVPFPVDFRLPQGSFLVLVGSGIDVADTLTDFNLLLE